MKRYDVARSDQFLNRFDRFFDDFFAPMEVGANRGSNNLMGIQFAELDSHYQVNLDLPGLEQKDINIEIKDDRIQVHGERKDEFNQDGTHGSYFGKFEKQFTLPKNADRENIEATYENGVLRLILPKTEVKSENKKIEVKKGKSNFLEKLLAS